MTTSSSRMRRCRYGKDTRIGCCSRRCAAVLEYGQNCAASQRGRIAPFDCALLHAVRVSQHLSSPALYLTLFVLRARYFDSVHADAAERELSFPVYRYTRGVVLCVFLYRCGPVHALRLSVNGAMNFPRRGDFFPYADNRDSYWVGYFVSRPALKVRRRASLFIAACFHMKKSFSCVYVCVTHVCQFL